MPNETPCYYYGSAENKLNIKGQVAIPARFRSQLPESELTRNYVIIRGEGCCLYMYTHRQFATIKDNARRVAEELGDIGFYRSFMSEAVAVEVDNQGRFVLPQHFMKAVGISGPGVLFLGVDDRIEIWDPATYGVEKQDSDTHEEVRQAAARKIFGI